MSFNQVLETPEIEPPDRAGSAIFEAKEFARTEEPPLSFTIPDGWSTNAACRAAGRDAMLLTAILDSIRFSG